MRTLVIDTATRACSVAFFNDDRLVGESHELIGRGHAEHLLPAIARFPENGRADRIAVNVGPGSFTGIRIGISAARALALAWQAECVGYGCLDFVAAIARDEAKAKSKVSVVMTGGHGEFFCGTFAQDGAPLSPPQSLTYEAALGSLTGDIVAGDAVDRFSSDLGNRKIVDTLPIAARWPLVSGYRPLPASALYVRPPDAKTKAELGH